jgi:hypothetical protein
MTTDTIYAPTGTVRLHVVEPNRVTPITPWQPNTVLYEWAAIAAQLLTAGERQYRISGMYLEYENVASSGDTVTVPSYGREASAGIAYYNGLAGSPVRDYLRVPLVSAQVLSTNGTNYPKGNQPVFFAQTSGVVGVHGLPFSEASNSKIFGAALVAILDEADATRDLVFSRFYLSTSLQQLKLASSQIGLEWKIQLS